MTARNDSTGRIEAGGAGVEEFSNRDVETRAQQLAMQEGRAEVTTDLIERARRELTDSGQPANPDDDSATLSVEARAPDEVIGSSGRKAKNIGPQDEANVPQQLVEEGIAEADHERMSEAEWASRRRERLEE